MLSATCPKCGRVTRMADVMAGRTITCGGCGAPVQLPGTAAVQTAGAGRAMAVAKPARTTGGGGRRFGFHLNRATIAILILGGFLCFFGGRELLLSSVASAAPQDITCAKLVADGYGKNAHVRLHDFRMLPNYIVEYKGKRGGSDEGKWTTAWVPIVSKEMVIAHMDDDGQPDWAAIKTSPDLHVMLETDQVKSEADFEAHVKLETIDGMVMNKVESLGKDKQAKLRSAYPTMDMDTCYILAEGREPKPGLGLLGLAGGIVVVLVGLWMLLKPD